MFEQFVGGHVVMGGVQADICEHDSGFMPAKRVDGIEEVDAVVAFRAVKFISSGRSTLNSRL